jgi:hypothetical protein
VHVGGVGVGLNVSTIRAAPHSRLLLELPPHILGRLLRDALSIRGIPFRWIEPTNEIDSDGRLQPHHVVLDQLRLERGE